MARILEAALGARSALLLPTRRDVADLLDRNGKADAFDAGYGETLDQLLPQRLRDFPARH